MTLSRRPFCSTDQEFLRGLYASTRTEEMANLGWSATQLEMFFRMQFSAQQLWYTQVYPDAKREIILKDDLPMGQMIVLRRADEIRLIDISLLPEARNLGIGTLLIGGLIGESGQSGIPLRLQVLKSNRAGRLYERLGFEKASEDDLYYQMERNPA